MKPETKEFIIAALPLCIFVALIIVIDLMGWVP